MKWFLIFLSIASGIIGCGQGIENIFISDKLTVIVQELEKETEINIKCSIVLADKLPDINDITGEIGYSFGSVNLILLKDTKINDPDFSNAQKKALIMHEIGHCQFGLDHNNDAETNGRPISIMHQGISNYVYTDTSWEENRDYWLQDIYKINEMKD
jgi:hypothetical protein